MCSINRIIKEASYIKIAIKIFKTKFNIYMLYHMHETDLGVLAVIMNINKILRCLVIRVT